MIRKVKSITRSGNHAPGDDVWPDASLSLPSSPLHACFVQHWTAPSFLVNHPVSLPSPLQNCYLSDDSEHRSAPSKRRAGRLGGRPGMLGAPHMAGTGWRDGTGAWQGRPHDDRTGCECCAHAPSGNRPALPVGACVHPPSRRASLPVRLSPARRAAARAAVGALSRPRSRCAVQVPERFGRPARRSRRPCAMGALGWPHRATLPPGPLRRLSAHASRVTGGDTANGEQDATLSRSRGWRAGRGQRCPGALLGCRARMRAGAAQVAGSPTAARWSRSGGPPATHQRRIREPSTAHRAPAPATR